MKTIFWTLVLSGCLQLPAQAQTPTDYPQAWTLENCINYAKTHNISINKLSLSEKSSEQDLLQAKAARLPNLNGTLNQGIENMSVANQKLDPSMNFSNTIGFNSSLPIYNGNYIRNDINSKQLAIQSSRLSVQEAQNDISLSIAQAFLNILMVKENITYLQELLKTSKMQADQGDKEYKAGTIAKKDYLQFQSQVAADTYNLVNTQNQLRSALVNLKQILQLPASYTFDIQTPKEIEVSSSNLMSLEQAESTAQSNRPEIKNSLIAIKIAELELKKTQASTLPTLSLVGAMNSSFSDNGQNSFVNQWGNNFYQSLGLSLAIPIANRRLNKTAIEKAKINIDDAKLDKMNTLTVLNQQVEQSYINFNNAIAQYQAAQIQLNINKQTLDITTAEAKIGSINLVELQQQRILYVQAFQAFTQAKYTAILNKKIVEFYTGIPLGL